MIIHYIHYSLEATTTTFVGKMKGSGSNLATKKNTDRNSAGVRLCATM